MIARGLALVAALALAGCYKLGPETTEPATVVAVSYVPSTSGSGVASNGKVVFTSTEAAYAVTLRCQHGNFALEGEEGSPAWELWKNALVGDILKVHYREKIGHDGEVRGFRFLSAERVRR